MLRINKKNIASTLTFNLSISNAYIFYTSPSSLNQLNLQSVQNIEIIQQMFKGIRSDYWSQSSCFFQCGACETSDPPIPKQQKTLSRYKSHQKQTIRRSGVQPFIQLGPRPAQQRLTIKETGKISIRKRMKSIELQRLNRKGSKEEQLRDSSSNIMTKSVQTSEQKIIRKIKGQYINGKDLGYLQYLVERTQALPQSSIKSADQTSFTPKNYFQQNFKRNQTRKTTATFKLDWKQNTVPKLSLYKQLTLKLGQDLPTLRSEAQPTISHFSQRNGLLKY